MGLKLTFGKSGFVPVGGTFLFVLDRHGQSTMVSVIAMLIVGNKWPKDRPSSRKNVPNSVSPVCWHHADVKQPDLFRRAAQHPHDVRVRARPYRKPRYQTATEVLTAI